MRIASFVLLLAVAAVAQPPTVVTGGGVNLQAAIAAASPGDVLDVHPGGYSAITVSIGIRIECRPGVLINPPGLFQPAVVITGVPARQACVISGGDLGQLRADSCVGAVVVAGWSTSRNYTGFEVINCTGPVAFQRVDLGSSYLRAGRGLVTGSPQVSLTGCQLPATRIDGSNVSLVDCTVPPRNMEPGLHISSARVVIRGGRFEGGEVFSWGIDQPGIRLHSGRLWLTGGATVVANQYWFTLLQYPPAPAIGQPSGYAEVHIDPSVTLISPAVPPIAAQIVVVNETIPSLLWQRQPGSSAFSLTVEAEPGSLTMTALGLPAPVVSLPFGELWLHPGSPVFHTTVMPQSGQRTITGMVPPLPPYLVVVLQSVSFTVGGGVILGAPVRVVNE